MRNLMTRFTYVSNKENLKFSHNTTLDKNDKLPEVRPYIKTLNENFMHYGLYFTHLPVDEPMIPYFVKH